MQAIAGSIAAASGLFGMFRGLRGAKVGPGIGPMFSVLAGQEEAAAARAEAGLLGQQSDIAFTEAQREAARKAREVRAFREQQAAEFASGGGLLAGSKLAVLAETEILGQQEVSAIKRRGQAQADLFSAQGLQLLRRGSAAAFGGIAQSLQQQFASDTQAFAARGQAAQTGLAGLATAFGFGAFARNKAAIPSRGSGIGASGLSFPPSAYSLGDPFASGNFNLGDGF